MYRPVVLTIWGLFVLAGAWTVAEASLMWLMRRLRSRQKTEGPLWRVCIDDPDGIPYRTDELSPEAIARLVKHLTSIQ